MLHGRQDFEIGLAGGADRSDSPAAPTTNCVALLAMRGAGPPRERASLAQ